MKQLKHESTSDIANDSDRDIYAAYDILYDTNDTNMRYDEDRILSVSTSTINDVVPTFTLITTRAI